MVSVVKNLPANAGDVRDTGLIPGLGRRTWQPTPVFLPGKFHEQRSLVSYSPWGCKRDRRSLVPKNTTKLEKKVKLSLFAGDTKLHVENTKDATIKLLQLINKFDKVAGYKINTQKCVGFLYTRSERSEREIKERIPFTIISKRIKHLGINLSKGLPWWLRG